MRGLARFSFLLMREHILCILYFLVLGSVEA